MLCLYVLNKKNFFEYVCALSYKQQLLRTIYRESPGKEVKSIVQISERIGDCPRWLAIVHIKHIAVAVVELAVDCIVVRQVDALLEIPLPVEVESTLIRAQDMQIDGLTVSLAAQIIYQSVQQH